jgi:hypothetical protein
MRTLGGRPARLRQNSSRAGGGAGRGRGRGGPLGHLGAHGCQDLGAEAAGEAARRRWPALAAVAGISDEAGANSGNARRGRLPRGLREV